MVISTVYNTCLFAISYTFSYHAMLAIEIIDKVLKNSSRPIPKLSGTEVLIKVVAAGVNRPDIMQRQGLYPPPMHASDIPGLEISGIIIKIGRKVRNIKTGDKVCALVVGGGYAEYCVADAELCLPIPSNFDFIHAAAIPETFFTVWSNLFDRAQLEKNETLLIHGGSSGIGTTAIQLAKAFGAKVFITAGSAEKCLFCTKLGADMAIYYKEKDFVAEINNSTQDKGVDVILDIIGGNYFSRNLKCMGTDARLLQIAIQNGGPKLK